MSEEKKKIIKKSLIIILPVVFMAGLIITFSVIYFSFKPYNTVVLEAGDKLVAADKLLKDGQTGAKYVSGDDVDTTKVGQYKLKVKNGLFTYTITLEIKDTVAPVVATKDVVTIFKDAELLPEDFIESISDKTGTKVTFETDISSDAFGYFDAKLVVTDDGENAVQATSKLHVVDDNIVGKIDIEAGQNISADDFFVDSSKIDEEYTLEPSVTSLDVNTLGQTEFSINIHNDKYNVIVTVVDTIAPTGQVSSINNWIGNKVAAEAFLVSYTDETSVTCTYKTEPDFSIEGSQPVTIVLTDEYGNKTEYSTTLVLKADTEKPVISGATPKDFYVGEPMNFTYGVYAKDNKDGDVNVITDTSKVNINAAGSYNVIYTAKDSSGNVATATGLVVIHPQRTAQQIFDEKINKILGGIVTSNMDERAKVSAIYNWIYGHVVYVGTSQKGNWQSAALEGINTGKGDCYTFFALSKALLTAAGIDNIDIERSPDSPRTSHHYWNLVNIGTGWYHFDTCHKAEYLNGCMFTDAQAAEYNNKVAGYYTYDASKYPDIQ